MADLAIIKQNAHEIELRKQQYVGILRELIVNGSKLTEAQIVGRAQFAAIEGLDPITEVHTLVDRDGKTMSHMMAMTGYRRKCQEQVGPGNEIIVTFRQMEKAELPNNAFCGHEAELRDGQSYQQWQKRLLDIGKTLREAMGGPVTYDQLIKAVGPAPVFTGIGIVYNSELNEWKDKSFNPIERSKKRAERNARARRFPVNSPVFDTEAAEVYTPATGAIDAQFVDVQPQPQPEPRSEADLLQELGYDQQPAQPQPKPQQDHKVEFSKEQAGNGQQFNRPLEPTVLVDLIGRKASWHLKNHTQCSTKQRSLVVNMLEEIFSDSPDPKARRHELLKMLTGYSHMGEIQDWYVLSMLDWISPTKDSGGAYIPNEMAGREARAAWQASNPQQDDLFSNNDQQPDPEQEN